MGGVTAAENRDAYIHGIIVTVNITCLTYIIYSMGIFYIAAPDGAAVLDVPSMREIMIRCLFWEQWWIFTIKQHLKKKGQIQDQTVKNDHIF